MRPVCLDDYRDTILATDFDAIATPGQIPAAWRVAEAGNIVADYIPFDYVNPAARVALIGITPGFYHWKAAGREAQRRLRAGSPDAEVLRAAKQAGAFTGAIRPNLVALLDRIGLQHWLGLAGCASLFDEHAHLLHVNGVLRQPIFVDGKNYSGAAPNMLTTPLLQSQMLDYFAHEAALLPDAVFVPLGPKVAQALAWLAGRGVLDATRILHGLPHPSGANAERVAYFLGRKARDTLSSRTNGARLDADRTRLLAHVAGLN